jgi:hypothetical protein
VIYCFIAAYDRQLEVRRGWFIENYLMNAEEKKEVANIKSKLRKYWPTFGDRNLESQFQRDFWIKHKSLVRLSCIHNDTIAIGNLQYNLDNLPKMSVTFCWLLQITILTHLVGLVQVIMKGYSF